MNIEHEKEIKKENNRIIIYNQLQEETNKRQLVNAKFDVI
jgi:hypothetical protein